jgi:eukaryotic-like serine/threonine-protein kinase
MSQPDENDPPLIARAAAKRPGSVNETVPPTDTARAEPSETVFHQQASKAGPDVTVDHQPVPVGFAATIDSIKSLASSGKASAAAAPRPTVEGYTILSELGRGGMGVVYKARQIKLNRIVALKMVLAGGHAGPDQLARFYSEAEAVAHLQHPHIVQIYEVGEHGGLPYFSLEYVNGGSLSEQIGGKPQPVGEAARQVELLARAMAYAHDEGIVHRDLKPANVLLSKDGQPKITDFGLAKRLESDSSQTKSGTLMGTPSYMAPEQARGEVREVGPLADVYALGVILYEMLVGRTPFLGASILDTLQQVRSQEPVPPSHLQPKVPRDLETICLRCLQKDPHKRYASAAALAEDLRRFSAGEPILARRVGRVERAWRWCKRNPRVAALSAAVAVLLVASVGAFSVAAVRSAREQRTLGEVRIHGKERIEQATKEIQVGNVRRAQDLLSWNDPHVESNRGLADMRAELHGLRGQVQLYSDIKRLADNARYHGLFGARGTLKEAQRHCLELVEIYKDLENKSGKAASGLPPLNTEQRQLLQEDIFETFVLGAHVESELAASSGNAEAVLAAAKKGLELLAQAEPLLPATRLLYRRRSEFFKTLGDAGAAKKDIERANAIEPTSVVDRFWNGVNEHQLAEADRRRGNAKGMQEHYRTAIAEYASLLRIRPDHYWTYFDWAWCQMQIGEPHGAIVGFTACIQLKPEIPWPYYNRGMVYWQLKQADVAIQDFGAAIERNSQYADAFYNRGVALNSQGKAEQALADCQRAIELNPKLSLAHYQRGEIFRAQKKHAQAVEDYGRAIENSPENASAYSGRGVSYFSMADYAKARDDFSKLIALQPKQPAPLRLRATANMYLKDFEASLSDWAELARLQPNNPEPHYNTALIHKARRDYDKALVSLSGAMRLKGDDARCFLTRAQIYHQSGKLAEALADRNLALSKREVNKSDALNDRADVYRAMGMLDEAAADYQASIELASKQLDPYIGLAIVHRRRGKGEEANACYENMVAANPDSAMAYIRRAEFRRSLSEFQAALADCDDAAKRDSKSVLPDLVRASVQAAQNQVAPAVAEAERIVTTGPSVDGNALYCAACVFSLAAQATGKEGDGVAERARGYADRAAALLAQALEKGFLDLSYQHYNRVGDDPALASILSHPGVQRLLSPDQ